MVQSKVYRELVNLGANLTNIDISEDYATQSISQSDSSLYGAGENNLLPSKTINSDQGEEALAAASAALSLLSTPKKNSACINLSQNSE